MTKGDILLEDAEKDHKYIEVIKQIKINGVGLTVR